MTQQPDADGVRISRWNHAGNANQRFQLQRRLAGAVDVTTLRALNKFLDVAGTQLIIWTCHGGTNRRWTLP